jgi:hypothetical protein
MNTMTFELELEAAGSGEVLMKQWGLEAIYSQMQSKAKPIPLDGRVSSMR